MILSKTVFVSKAGSISRITENYRCYIISQSLIFIKQKRSHEISYTRGGVPLRVANVSLYGSNIRNICTLSQ